MMRPKSTSGFSIMELVISMIVVGTISAMAIPTLNSALIGLRLNATATAISAALSNTRYRALKDSQIYTVVFTTPGNTYVVKDVPTNTSDAAVPLPNTSAALNGGGTATYTFTFCPNGTVYGAGGACPGVNAAPVLAATYSGQEIDITTSSTGNVTTTRIH